MHKERREKKNKTMLKKPMKNRLFKKWQRFDLSKRNQKREGHPKKPINPKSSLKQQVLLSLNKKKNKIKCT